MRLGSVTWLGLILTLVLLAPEGKADTRVAQTVASYDDTELLKKRFLAAVFNARRPESFDHADSLIDVLLTIEKDHAIKLRTREMIRALVEAEPRYKELYEPGRAKGIASFRPLEKAAETDKKVVQKTFLVDAINLSGICLPSEAAYNLRYVDFLERQPWPKEMSGYAPLRYALYLRMYKRDCIPEKGFLAHTKSHVPGVRKALLEADEAGDAGSYIYLLAASKRFDQVPGELLRRFIQAQDESGTWPGKQVGDPSVTAAQGAYVIATVLHGRGVTISGPELFYAENTKPPLPAPVAFKARP